jgi:hypothetical protein
MDAGCPSGGLPAGLASTATICRLLARIPRDEFVFEAGFDRAAYVIVDRIWLGGAVHIEGLADMLEQLGRWHPIGQQGDRDLRQGAPMRAISRSPLVRAVVLLILGGLLLALGIANYRVSNQFPGGNDFLPRWVGAREWLQRGTSPYDPRVSEAAQRMIYGRLADPAAGEDIAHFAYPPAMLSSAPLASLPSLAARAVWMTLIEVSLPALIIMGMGLAHWRPPLWLQVALLLFAVLSYHGIRTVLLGQFAAIEAVLMVGTLLAIQRRQDQLAGILLGLSIAKPHMAVLLIPFVLLWAVRSGRTIVAGWATATVGLLIGVSIALIPDWPVQWLRQLLDYPTYTVIGPPVSVLTGLLPRGQAALTLILCLLLLAYLIWEWLQSLGKEDRWFQWTAAMTLTITNLIALRTATTNFVVLFPALVLIFALWHERWGKAGEVAILLAILCLLIGLRASF